MKQQYIVYGLPVTKTRMKQVLGNKQVKFDRFDLDALESGSKYYLGRTLDVDPAYNVEIPQLEKKQEMDVWCKVMEVMADPDIKCHYWLVSR